MTSLFEELQVWHEIFRELYSQFQSMEIKYWQYIVYPEMKYMVILFHDTTPAVRERIRKSNRCINGLDCTASCDLVTSQLIQKFKSAKLQSVQLFWKDLKFPNTNKNPKIFRIILQTVLLNKPICQHSLKNPINLINQITFQQFSP